MNHHIDRLATDGDVVNLIAQKFAVKMLLDY
jgi:hypothetical protein